jgi:signal transduction histidine kinase
VIGRATAATESLLTDAGPEMIVELEPGLPPLVGDRDRLIQVVINLISNAVKFTPKGSITCIARLDPGGHAITVSVIDTGIGIAPEDHERVFEQFGQAGDTLTDRPHGTGLGLPICREIVEHHGGRIWLESAVGAGARFSFTLPIASEPVGLAVTPGTDDDEVVAVTRSP